MIPARAARVRTGLAATALTAGTALAACLAAGPAQAATTHPDGFVTVMQCTGESGHISYSPGLWKASHAQNAVLTATLSGCSDAYSGAFSGTGSMSVILSGNSSKSAGSLSGSFVINWPASAGLNPSVGTATVNLATNTLTLSGSTSSTTGSWEGGAVDTSLVVTGHKGAGTKAHPIKQQTFVNSLPLTIAQNFG